MWDLKSNAKKRMSAPTARLVYVAVALPLLLLLLLAAEGGHGLAFRRTRQGEECTKPPTVPELDVGAVNLSTHLRK